MGFHPGMRRRMWEGAGARAKFGAQWNANWTPLSRVTRPCSSCCTSTMHSLGIQDSVEPSDELLKAGLAPWIGKGGDIDEAIAFQDADQSLAKRLSRKLMRRKEDPRRVALEGCYQAATLQRMDHVLGEVRGQLRKHNRLAAARLELDLGANPATALPRGQSVRVMGRAEFESLSARLTPEDGDAVELSVGEPFELAARGAAFRLQLKHPQLYTLGVDGIHVGNQSFGESNAFLIVAGRSDPWPENSFAGPVLDIQKSGGRRLKGIVDVPAGTSVEILVTSFPQDSTWQAGVKAEEGATIDGGVRPTLARLTGTGRMVF